MSLEVSLWLALAAYVLHILEEFVLDWKNWANRVLRLPVEWPAFYVTNAGVVVLGIVSAEIGEQLPAISLVFPALMIINAVFFHILPFILTRKFSPGLLTAVVLFLPIGLWTYDVARRNGLLSGGVVLVSVVLGAMLMAFPILLLKLKDRPFFRQL